MANKPMLDSAVDRKAGDVWHLQQENTNNDTDKPEEYKLTFEDGRRIDFVLCYEHKSDSVQGQQARDIFQRNLELEGLQLSYDKPEHGTHHYVLIHAPWPVLSRYADIMKIRMPMRELPEPEREALKAKSFWDRFHGVRDVFTKLFRLDADVVPPLQRRFTCVYSKDKEYLFDIPENKDLFFSNTQRSRIVDYILRRKRFTDKPSDSFHFGIRRMINDKFYTDAFPLHEGGYGENSEPNNRKLLYDNWACWKVFYKEQPLDYIRNYYGEKIGLYFAWLGFYTRMLFPAAVLGVIAFIYGLATMYSDTVANEICHPKDDIIMCPLCDLRCDFWNITGACPHARISHLFDNSFTFFFSVFITIWGTVFLNLWTRKQAEIQFKWGLSNFEAEEEPARPEFLAQLSKKNCRRKENYITGMEEPHFPFLRRRLPVFFCSFSVMLLLVALALVFMVGVITYRMCMLMVLYATDSWVVYKNASVFTSMTAALLNLIVIFLLNFVYKKLAEILTNWENLRTQSEYDDILTLKIYLLQFVNYYSSLLYIAFIKGRYTGQPNNYKRLFGARQEECMPGGCLIELCIQLFVIMVGKQFLMTAVHMFSPKLKVWFKRRWKKEQQVQYEDKKPWTQDRALSDPGTREIFDEYMEMLLQFGFVTIFVAAFPFAPLFALINNIIDIRGDAQKFVCSFRRPVAQRNKDIGIWYDCLFAVSRIAILTNAIIIAFTSDFVPRRVYEFVYSPDHSMHGFINNSLSYFAIEDFENDTLPLQSLFNYTTKQCRYKVYTFPPSSHEKYENTPQHWHIWAARLLFIATFENVCIIITSILTWMIPETPNKLMMQIRREHYITNEIILQTELIRAGQKDKTRDTRLPKRDLELIVDRADELDESRGLSRPESLNSAYDNSMV